MKKIFENLEAIILLCTTILLVGGLILTSVLIIDNPYHNYNSQLHENIYKLNITEEFVFNDIVPFDWDKLYTFEPGTTKSEIEEILGFENGKIKDIPKDANSHIIFIKDNQITAYPNVNNIKIDYNINLMKNKNKKYAVLDKNHFAVFYVEFIGDTIELFDMELFTTEEGMKEYENKKSSIS